MKITAVEEYGLRCLVRVGEGSLDAPISAQEIAEIEGISLPYAQKLLRILAQGEIVESIRGANGGYVLTRPAEQISLGDAMRVLGGMIEPDNICERHTGTDDVCRNAVNCSIRPVWSQLSDFIIRTFDSIPLSLLVEDESEVRRRLQALLPVPLAREERPLHETATSAHG